MNRSSNTTDPNELDQVWENILEFGRKYRNCIHSIVVTPRKFFRQQRDETDFWEPTLFATINILIPNMFFALIFAPITLGLSLFLAIPAMLYSVIILMLAAVMLHGLIRIIGATHPFVVTYRCVAYASVSFYVWLIPIPFLNLLAFVIVLCGLLYFAFTSVHELDPQKALLVVFLPGIILLVIGILKTFLNFYIFIRGVIRLMEFLPI
jgi:hypothetical protein